MVLIFILYFLDPINVSEYTLQNGLKVLIYEDHFAPVVATQVHYRVGGFNEPQGLTGISHLLEHMAFKGTKKYGPKIYDRIIDEAGGEENAFTSIHRTVYWANLHKDRYTIELELEADRMQNLLIAEKEFETEKGVVMEERRLGENDPYNSLFELLDLTSYTYSPYRNPVVGFMGDLERMMREDVYNWYKKFYNPANVVIVIAGDVIPEAALKLVKKYYGKIIGIKQKEEPFVEPPQNGEKRFEMKKDVKTSALAIQYHTVAVNQKDSYTLDIVARILSQGRNSRFERILVRQRGIAASVNVYSSTLTYDGSFVIFGIPQTGIDISSLENEIDKEIERLKVEEVSDEELTKAKNQVLAQTIYRRDSPAGMGFTIGRWEIEGGGWQNINLYPEEIQKVTKKDIMGVAKKYFIKDNRTVGYLLPMEAR